jgi:RHS repeat-associated protein
VTDRDTLTETVQGVTTTYAYGYDARGRLETVHTNGTLTATWGYDANGNRISQVTGAGTTVGLVDDQDRLLAWGAASYTYDANGDLTTRTDSAGLTSYDYDLFGNLRRVDLPSGDVVEYLVDGQNRRVGRVFNGAVTHKWLYKDQLNPVAELDAAGNVVARFIYGTTYHAPDVMLKGGVTYRLITDHLGSVRLVVDVATGTVAQRLDYDEWGRVLVDTNPGFQPFGFAGGLYDSATGLVRFGVRDYDAEVGRWTAKDPIRFAGGDENIYAYVGGDPVGKIDPEGDVAVATGGNGNTIPGHQRQDDRCSVPGRIGSAMNSSRCIKECCQRHDRCFSEYKCNMSSWIPTLVGMGMDCGECNKEVVRCIASATVGGCGCD